MITRTVSGKILISQEEKLARGILCGIKECGNINLKSSDA